MRARFGASLAVAVALVGCTLKGTPVATNQHAKGGGTTASASATPRPKTSTQPLIQPEAPFSPLTPASTPAPAPTSAGQPATPQPLLALTGHVLLPAAIVSNNGGGIITDNGGGLLTEAGAGLITEGGSGFHVLALDAQPAKGVTVQLVDAAGRRLQGTDGKPIQAVTDAQGAFSIAGSLPAANVLAVVDFGQGRMASASVVQGRTGELTIDFASSMATAYIIEKYVRSQPDQDPLKVFDRLTPGAELAARQATADALNTGTVKAETLALGQLVTDCDKLIQAAPTLGARMEDVKKLLLVGGLADLGNGHTATHVGLNYVSSMAVAPDGTLYLEAEYDGRVWRLNAQGQLETAFGQEGDEQDVEAITVDAKNRLLVLKGDDVVRIENGTSTKVGTVTNSQGGFVMAGDGDTVYLANTYTWDTTATLYTFAPGQAAKQVKLDFGAGSHLWGCGRSADGKIHGYITHESATTSKKSKAGLATGLYLIDPAAGTLTQERAGEVMLDSAGHVFTAGSKQMKELVNGQAQVVGPQPKDDDGVVAVASDGHGGVYTSDFNRVYHVTAGGAVLVAGPPASGPIDIPASDFGYQEPSGLAIAPDGTMYVADHGLKRVLKVGADQHVRNIEPDTTSVEPHVLRLGPQGEVYVGDAYDGVVYQVTQQGYQEVYKDGEAGELLDFTVGPRGEIYASTAWWTGEENEQVTCTYQGKTTVVLKSSPDTDDEGGYALAVQADGQLLIAGHGKLQRWSEAGGLTTVASNEALSFSSNSGDSGEAPGIVADAKNRLIIANGSTVERYDPATNTFTTLAGQAPPEDTGDGEDEDEDEDEDAPKPLKQGEIGNATAPAFAPDGSLRFIDTERRVIQQLPASAL